MEQVTFGAAEPDAARRMVRRYAHSFLTIWGKGAALGVRANATRAPLAQPTHFTPFSCRKPPLAVSCHVETWHATHCFYSDKNKVCNVSTTRLSRRRYGPVTLVAQACNAKKNFAGLSLDGARLCSCNVCRAGRLADKFPKNRVVSTAVTHLLNCIVYDRHHLSTTPDRLRLAGMAARITARRIFLTRLHLTAGGSR
ncbi:hypothetical protein [Burkholderia sp. IMCC1007]|uniref:hypothetical protein n=1 Tax=Burkholderia sp. IMCC1007 TaxID=3004104 RepID=UPI0022B381F8|nr:hypothetical protein [Burkholderia sp. IMCC1007]